MTQRERPTYKTLAENRKAWFNYFIEEKVEAGIALTGPEVKAARAGKISLLDAYASADRGELFLSNCNISQHSAGHFAQYDPLRKRKLLLHKREIEKLAGSISRQGYTLLPLRVYLKGSLIKVELGLGKGKKLHDKRDTLKKKAMEREVSREFKLKGRGTS